MKLLILVFGYVTAQEYFEQLHSAKYGKHVEEIPRKFEIKGDNAISDFGNRFKQIQDIAKRENMTVIYKVMLELVKPYRSHNKKIILKKKKSKKYNVPLKKNSMKLSNFEVYLRKIAEHTGRQAQIHEEQTATTEKKPIVATKQIILKYKPIISKIRTNYTKIIRPVKNRVITLTS